ncbi:hypothetical protein [Microbulbifer taiwanensis]|uniref:Uncharacterized protein n=1 Tax=Microbulbifer taiwanensis TaxID=986746 RepID=A0ABW1YSG5_9GAMM|nr:hypothetical protein [Microbulbifer taiwanensis]
MSALLELYWPTIILALSVLMLFTTTRLAFANDIGRVPSNFLLRFLTSWVWATPLTLLGATVVGYFLSGELSPWPFETYRLLIDRSVAPEAAAAVALAVVSVDVWLLWMPAKIYLWTRPDLLVMRFKVHCGFACLGLSMLIPWLTLLPTG